jgi:hypothetical protein
MTDYHQYELSNEAEYPAKNPNRVSGGKKAAAHFTHEELSERAQQAANTRAMRDTQSHSGSRPAYTKATVKRHQQRQQAEDDDDQELEAGEEEDDMEDEQDGEDGEQQPRASGSRSSGSVAPRKHNTRSHDDDDHPILRSEDKKRGSTGNIDDWRRFELENEPDYPNKDPSRVAAGKRVAVKAGHEELSTRARQAAETRALRASGSHSGSRPPYTNETVSRHHQRNKERDQDQVDGEEDEDAAEDDEHAGDNDDDDSGRPTGRAGKGGGRMDYPQYELSNEAEYPTKNPNRVSGGKKAAAHFTHEELSERAQQAANTRAMRDTQSHSGSRPAYTKATVKRHQQRQQQQRQAEDNEDQEGDEEGASSGRRDNKRVKR